MKRLHTTVEEYNMRATSYKSVSGFVPSALRPDPASQDFRYARNVMKNGNFWKDSF